LDRARNEAPDVVIDADQARAVAELCERLDGLPLALELAASRARAFSPVELVAQLEERFRMLVGGRRSRMERHQTMRGTLDWSYELCSEVEQVVFDRLAVFPTGFDLDAARAVAGGDGVSEFDVVDVVAHLVHRSLLQRSTVPDGTTRYRMLETMRAYGREHLQHHDTAEATRARHARYMATTIGALGLHLYGPDEEHAERRLNEYLADSLVALDWCIEHEEWENALNAIPLSDGIAHEANAMITRLHDAARSGGAPEHLIDELACSDLSQRQDESVEQMVERGWRIIRAGQPISPERMVKSPHGQFGDGGLGVGDVDEFIDSLDAWTNAPPAARFLAEYSAARALIRSGHFDRVESQLTRCTSLAEELQSPDAARMVNEIRGALALERHDWDGAVHWYSKVADAQHVPMRGHHELSAAWDLLTARCMSTSEVVITGDDVREPWRCYREEHLDMLLWRGATSTAIALHRIEHTDLARRFVAWAYKNDTAGIMEALGFADLVEIAGLTTDEVDLEDDLETLLDELFTVASELDQHHE
jgi:hypothetical protein